MIEKSVTIFDIEVHGNGRLADCRRHGEFGDGPFIGEIDVRIAEHELRVHHAFAVAGHDHDFSHAERFLEKRNCLTGAAQYEMRRHGVLPSGNEGNKAIGFSLQEMWVNADYRTEK